MKTLDSPVTARRKKRAWQNRGKTSKGRNKTRKAKQKMPVRSRGKRSSRLRVRQKPPLRKRSRRRRKKARNWSLR